MIYYVIYPETKPVSLPHRSLLDRKQGFQQVPNHLAMVLVHLNHIVSDSSWCHWLDVRLVLPVLSSSWGPPVLPRRLQFPHPGAMFFVWNIKASEPFAGSL